jgi:hypothetical protein
METSRRSAARRRPNPLVPLVLVSLAVLDLRVDLRILMDHFTLTSLAEAVRFHLLAVMVLLLTPSLWRRYGA